MDKRHTPGPWIAVGKYVEKRYPQYTHNMAIASTEANARLIAAAPELLAALEAMIEMCGCSIAERNSGHRIDCPSTMGIEAIKKARGEE